MLKITIVRLFLATLIVYMLAGITPAGELKPVKLNAPDIKRGPSIMEVLSIRASAQEWSDKELSIKDLSDLLWAANGINRPAEKKYTAPSAQNAHDIDLYLFMKDGVYLYDADKLLLNPVVSGDYRSLVLVPHPSRPADATDKQSKTRLASFNPPILIVLVSDSSRFKSNDKERKHEMGAFDAGIVSQNISLFCAATGLKTRPRASMDKEKIKQLLKLKDHQYVFLNHPVGY